MRPRDFVALGIFVREAFLDAPTLAALRQSFADEPGDPAEVFDPLSDDLTLSSEVRRAWDVPLPDALEAALLERLERLRPELEQWCGQRLEPCDALAALRYPAGAFYRTHRDASAQPDTFGLHRRAVSVVVFVNSGEGHTDAEFAGGALRLHELLDNEDDGGLDIWPEAGTLVAFPSALLHEVTRVDSGVRCTLVTWLMAADMPGADAP